MFYIAGHEVMLDSSIRIDSRSHRVNETDIWTYPLLRPEHASSPSRRARSPIPTHSGHPPGWPLASKYRRSWLLGIPGLTASADLWRYPETEPCYSVGISKRTWEFISTTELPSAQYAIRDLENVPICESLLSQVSDLPLIILAP